MTTLVVSQVSRCAANTHIAFDVSVGARTKRLVLHVDELRAVPDPNEVAAALRLILRLALRGKTRAEVRALFAAGFTISVVA